MTQLGMTTPISSWNFPVLARPPLWGEEADMEFDAIQAVLPKYRTPVTHYLLAILLMVTQQLSGINSVIITTVSPDPELDVSVPSTDSAILLALLQAATVLVVLPFVDTLGRRKLLVVSVAVCWGSMTYLGIIYYTYGPDRPVVIHERTKTPPDYTYEELATPDAATDTYGTLKFALKVLFVVGFSVGLGPVPWVLAAELVPLRGTGLEFGSVCAANWAGSFVTANFVTTATTSRMIAVSLWLYGCIAITGGLISFALLPDTDCMSIEDILLIDPDERARKTKIKSTHKGKVFAPPGSVWPAISTAVAQPQRSSTKNSMPDRHSSDLTRSLDSDAKKPQSSLNHAPTESLTKEKPRSDDSQAQSKAPNKEFDVVTEQRERTMDSRKSSVASQKSTVSMSSASLGHPGRSAKKAKGVE
ncbi:hypothetical protein HPB51_018630 [Rhipicephalus microplus]|uniref:Major facilitator superfamily (MFS) profile domain-containing protein n=1 Tax=Rhipicephalus microplus TaxID=6941 RepID=A0A9J6F5L4_RHIMP|nr:hypothetical protein HPB51_018630 [Rhipicephalus microplus]